MSREKQIRDGGAVIGSGGIGDSAPSWTPLQLWAALRRVVSSPDKAVPMSELRDEVFDGMASPVIPRH